MILANLRLYETNYIHELSPEFCDKTKNNVRDEAELS
jgi:hypothetical protein